ncbi:MAG: hypothetical protein LBN98_02065 [Prevotellaceae bacterium]|jgi:hypothetical protein|nr:hypothetical protein [Prevotellaceae bacterium]
MKRRPHFRVGGGLFVARRAKISIEKDTPRIANSPQGFHAGAFYTSPAGNGATGWRHCSIDIVALTGKRERITI